MVRPLDLELESNVPIIQYHLLSSSNCFTDLTYHKKIAEVKFAVYMYSMKVITGTHETLTIIRVFGVKLYMAYTCTYSRQMKPVDAEDCSVCTHVI